MSITIYLTFKLDFPLLTMRFAGKKIDRHTFEHLVVVTWSTTRERNSVRYDYSGHYRVCLVFNPSTYLGCSGTSRPFG